MDAQDADQPQHPATVDLVSLWRLGRAHDFVLVGYTPEGQPIYNAPDGTGPYDLEGNIVEGACVGGRRGGGVQPPTHSSPPLLQPPRSA